MREQVGKLLLFVVCVLPTMAFGQWQAGGGWVHISGNNGLNGFNGDMGYQFNRTVTLVGDVSFLWDTSKVGVFDLVPSTGAVTIKSNEQNYLGGARVKLTNWSKTRALQRKKLLPFAELMFGVSRLHQSIESTTNVVQLSASDKAFTWLLGGGVDYRLGNSGHWFARGNLDFVRTHFANEGQSRYRLAAGLAYYLK